MEYIKPTVTIDLDEYNDLIREKKDTKESNSREFEAYKDILSKIVNQMSPRDMPPSIDGGFYEIIFKPFFDPSLGRSIVVFNIVLK